MRVPISFIAIVSEKFAQAVLKKAGVESWGMQGFRAALVITGFVVLGLGSNLAWHYPRPVPLGLHNPSYQLLTDSARLEEVNIRCRPNADWSDLLVESKQAAQAQQTLIGNITLVSDRGKFVTPPDLLADLGRLPGVKESNVWIRDDHEAVVTLSVRHGAFAADPHLMKQVVECVQSARPVLDANNIKILDDRGSDLNYSQPKEYAARPLKFQTELQQVADNWAGPKQALVFCHLYRSQDFRIHLQSSLLLAHTAADRQNQLKAELNRRMEKWTATLNKDLQGENYWQAEPVIYPNLGETDYRARRDRMPLDREHGVSLDELEVKEWTLRQRPLPQEYVKMAVWGLTAPVPTPWQLGLGLTALAPAIFAWCLLVPWLVGRHRLGQSSANISGSV